MFRFRCDISAETLDNNNWIQQLFPKAALAQLSCRFLLEKIPKMVPSYQRKMSTYKIPFSSPQFILLHRAKTAVSRQKRAFKHFNCVTLCKSVRE